MHENHGRPEKEHIYIFRFLREVTVVALLSTGIFSIFPFCQVRETALPIFHYAENYGSLVKRNFPDLLISAGQKKKTFSMLLKY